MSAARVATFTTAEIIPFDGEGMKMPKNVSSTFDISSLESTDVMYAKKPPKSIKQYVFGEVLGVGAYGKVVEAWDTLNFRKVAIKIMKRQTVSKIHNGEESVFHAVSILKQLVHPNVVKMIEFFLTDEDGSVLHLNSTYDSIVNDDELTLIDNCENDEGEGFYYYKSSGRQNNFANKKFNNEPRYHQNKFTKDTRNFTSNDDDDDRIEGVEKVREMLRGSLKRSISRKLFGKFYLVLEHVDGGTLQSLLDNALQNRLPENQACSLFSHLILGTEYIHSMGIVHKDIKPENLLLTQEGVLKIADFGVAEQLGQSIFSSNLSPAPLTTNPSKSISYTVSQPITYTPAPTPSSCFSVSACTSTSSISAVSSSVSSYPSVSSVMSRSPSNSRLNNQLSSSFGTTMSSMSRKIKAISGTPAFQPPEVASGKNEEISFFKADVWALGVCLYLMVVGKFPFKEGNSVLNLYENIAKGEYTIPAGVSRPASELIRRVMDPDPETRATIEEAKLLVLKWSSFLNTLPTDPLVPISPSPSAFNSTSDPGTKDIPSTLSSWLSGNCKIM